MKSLEAAHELPAALLSKLFSGERRGFDAATAPKMARALGVSIGWLLEGKGAPPILTGPIRPREDKYAEHDPAYWAQLAATETGELDPKKMLGDNHFEEARRAARLDVAPSVIEKAKKEHADKYPNGLTPIGWIMLFRTLEQARPKRRRKSAPALPVHRRRASGDGHD